MLLHAGKSPDETCFRWLEAEGPVLACDREVVTSLQVFNGKRLFPISSSSGVTFGVFFFGPDKENTKLSCPHELFGPFYDVRCWYLFWAGLRVGVPTIGEGAIGQFGKLIIQPPAW